MAGTILLFSRMPDPACKVEQLIIALAKLFLVYSSVYGKGVNEINDFMMGSVLKSVLDGKGLEGVMADILARRTSAELQKSFLDVLQCNLAFNPTAKNLVCRLSAMLDEDGLCTGTNGELAKRLFELELDIEHIEAVNHKDGTKRDAIWKEWGVDLHGIGNLMVLERKINRSISNEDYETTKLPHYAQSKFQIVRNQRRYSSWNQERCRDRKKHELEKIMGYLFV
jgi:hypothetical protein